MIDFIRGLFETFSQSSKNHKDETLHPLLVKSGVDLTSNNIINILKSLKYKEIKYNEFYHEFFTSKAGYEVTISLTSMGASTIINVGVYSPSNRGKTRKALRFLLNNLKTNLKYCSIYNG